jgi:hypothetical protein
VRLTACITDTPYRLLAAFDIDIRNNNLCPFPRKKIAPLLGRYLSYRR